MKKIAVLALLTCPAFALNSHPRIWLTPTLLSTLATKVSANDADWLALKAKADTFKGYTVAPYSRDTCATLTICYSYLGQGWYDAMLPLALAYQATGDTTYADQAVLLLQAMNAPYKDSASLDPITTSNGYPTRFVLTAMAIGYDWLYDRLDSTTKTDTINTINAAYTWFSTGATPFAYCGSGDPCGGTPYMNFMGGHLLGFGAAGVATDGDNSQSSTIYTFIRAAFDLNMGYGLQAGATTQVTTNILSGGFNGGYYPESTNYGPTHVQRLLQLILLWQTSGQVDLTSTYSQWIKNSVKSVIYTMRPNMWQASDEGDQPGNCSGIMTQTYPLFLAYMLNGTTEGAWSEYVFRTMEANPNSCSTNPADGLVPAAYQAFLWKDSSRTSADYSGSLAFNYLSQGDGHLLARSDWTTNAVALSYNGSAAHFTDHQNYVAGNIEMERGSDYLLVDSAQWKTLTGYGNGNPSIFMTAATYASTLFFDDGGAYLYVGTMYVGGQTSYGTTQELATRTDSSVSYVMSDLDQAYDVRPNSRVPANRTARFYYRSVAYMGGNTMFVWDRFRSKSSAYTKRLQWHLNPITGAPTVSSNLISTVVGSSKLYLDVLLPTSPTIATARDIATSDGTSNLTYNMQVSDSVTGTDLYGLTVAFATTSGGSLPTTTLLSTIDSNWVGAQVQDSTPLVAVFAQTVQDNGNNTYTPLTYASTSFTTTHTGTAKYLVAGLTAGTYNVGGSCVTNCTGQVVGSDGTLYFTGTSGAYSIAQGAGSVPSSILSGQTLTSGQVIH